MKPTIVMEIVGSNADPHDNSVPYTRMYIHENPFEQNSLVDIAPYICAYPRNGGHYEKASQRHARCRVVEAVSDSRDSGRHQRVGGARPIDEGAPR
jgi:hypothetical protein